MLTYATRTTAELDTAMQEIFTCCDKIFRSSKAYRQHVTTKHPRPKQPLLKFDRLLHSQAGLPICKMCGKGFAAWYNLQQHVENRVCRWHTDFSSDALPSTLPDLSTSQPAGVRQPPPRPQHSRISFTAPGQLTALACSLQALSPMLLSQSMQHSQRQDLRSHCVLCGQWVASTSKIKTHLTRTHKEVYQARRPDSDYAWLFTKGTRCVCCLKVDDPKRTIAIAEYLPY